MNKRKTKKQNKYNSLAIIGNGFDLAHGYKTSFGDFVEYSDSTEFKTFRKYLKTYCGSDENWNDFEARIEELTLRVFLENFSDNTDTVHDDIEKINETFKKLHTDLSCYLLKETSNKSSRYYKRIKKYLGRKTKILNFNYSDTVEKYSNNIFYVHGSLSEQNIVLGYDYRSEPCLACYENMLWEKNLGRERLFFKRYLKESLEISPKDSLYQTLCLEYEQIKNLEESGRGLDDEDLNNFNHGEIIREFIAKRDSEKLYMLPDINYSSIKKVIIIGHGLIADKMFISDVLKKCKNLKKIILFRYDGESENSFNAKINFLKPYCKRIVEVKYI